jgi:hypothetical protein
MTSRERDPGLSCLSCNVQSQYVITVNRQASQQFLAGLKAKCGLAEDYWSTRLEFQRYRTASYVESMTARAAG